MRTRPRALAALVPALILAGAAAAPLLGALGSVAAIPLYAAFSAVCHQDPARCWHLGAFPVAVCARCLGLYAGVVAGPLVRLRVQGRWPLLALAWLAIPGGPMVRFAAGLAAGFCLAAWLLTEQRVWNHRTSWVRRGVPA